MHAPQRHLFCPSTPYNDRAKSFGATSREGGNISKKGPQKGVQNFGAFGGGHFRGAGGSDASDDVRNTGQIGFAAPLLFLGFAKNKRNRLNEQ